MYLDYLPTYLMQKRHKSMETTRKISRPPTYRLFSFFLGIYKKIKIRNQCVPEEFLFFSFFHQNIPYEYPLLEGMPHEYMYPGILLLLLLLPP